MQIELLEQIEIDVGEIVDAVDPVGQRRVAEAGMRRGHDLEVAREKIEELGARVDSAGAMQQQEQRSGPAMHDLQLQAANRDFPVVDLKLRHRNLQRRLLAHRHVRAKAPASARKHRHFGD